MARGVPALRWVYPTVFRAGFERGRKENPGGAVCVEGIFTLHQAASLAARRLA